MSDASNKPTPNPFAELQRLLAEASRKHAEDAAREHARLAALSPAERAEEERERAEKERQRAEAAAKAAGARISQRYAKMGAPVLARESWTIREFSWLLVAENPMQRGSWLDTEMDKAATDQRAVRAVLESCVGVTLMPIQPPAPKREDERFRVADLIEVAQAKRLGHVALLRAMLENPKLPYRPALRPPPALSERSTERSPVPAALRERSSERSTVPAAPPIQRSGEHSSRPPAQPDRSGERLTPQRLAAAGTAAREQAPVRRQKDIMEFARRLVASGEGTATPHAVELLLNAETFNERFRAEHPRWSKYSDRSLNRDRRACSPPILVARGRPASDPA